MRKYLYVLTLVFLSACVTNVAKEVEARPDTSTKDWKLILNGSDLTGFMDTNGNKFDGLKVSPGKGGPGWVVEDGVMALKGKGGNIWTQKRYGDYILDFEVNTTGNSGLLIRCDNPKNYVQTCIEMQIEKKGGPGQKHGFGAIYDCLAPSEEVGGEGWHHVTLTCMDNKITVGIDGKQVIDMDLNQWDKPNKNPDGSKNKFKTAMKDLKREGHIGFQDHGKGVQYRNIRIKDLK